MKGKLNRIILCLGSNREDKEMELERAADRLRALFVSVRLANPVYTEPIGCASSAIFLNQVAVAYCADEAMEIKGALKEIERSLGRKPEDKKTGCVAIDIDLLQWNDRVFKPADLERDYVIAGIRSLLAAGKDDEWGEQEAE